MYEFSVKNKEFETTYGIRIPHLYDRWKNNKKDRIHVLEPQSLEELESLKNKEKLTSEGFPADVIIVHIISYDKKIHKNEPGIYTKDLNGYVTIEEINGVPVLLYCRGILYSYERVNFIIKNCRAINGVGGVYFNMSIQRLLIAQNCDIFDLGAEKCAYFNCQVTYCNEVSYDHTMSFTYQYAKRYLFNGTTFLIKPSVRDKATHDLTIEVDNSSYVLSEKAILKSNGDSARNIVPTSCVIRPQEFEEVRKRSLHDNANMTIEPTINGFITNRIHIENFEIIEGKRQANWRMYRDAGWSFGDYIVYADRQETSFDKNFNHYKLPFFNPDLQPVYSEEEEKLLETTENLIGLIKSGAMAVAPKKPGFAPLRIEDYPWLKDVKNE